MTEYKIDYSELSGEEMLTLGEIFDDIITVNQDDEDYDICSEIEEKHFKWYEEYKKSHPSFKEPHTNIYEDNAAWMHSQNRVLNWERNQIDNDMIWNYLMGKGTYMSDEQKEVWDKVVTEKTVNTYDGPDYSCCDRYDFTMCR